jgi:ketosteroid isomerase-like protein
MIQMKFNAFLGLLILVCFAASGQRSITADDKCIAFLKKFNADYIKSMLEKRPELLSPYYAEDIRLMPEFQKTIFTRRNALLYHKAFSSRFNIKGYTRETLDILDLDSRIVETGVFALQLTLKNSDQEYEIIGKYQNIWKKMENGVMQLMTNAWNHNSRSSIDAQFSFDDVPAVQVAFIDHVYINNNISFELAALNKLLESTIVEHNNEIWSQFYTDDAMLISNLNTITKGKPAIDAYLKAHVKEIPIFEKLDIRNDHIDHLGEYVIEYASHVANWRNGVSSGVNTGKNIRIWRRETDGSLKIFRQIGMYD